MPDRLLMLAYRYARRVAAGVTLRTVETNDGRLWPVAHHMPLGKTQHGVPVVLFHGFGNDSSTWVPFMRTLGETREIVAPDLPGFGRHRVSDGEELSPDWYRRVTGELLRELTVRWGQPPIVVGKSMGGMIAGLVAGDMPDLVRKLVLIAPAGIETPSVSAFWRMWDSGFNLLLPHDREEWERMVGTVYQGAPRIPGFVRREALRTIARDRKMLERVFDGLLTEGFNPLGSRLERIACPVAVIWGADDQVMDPSGLQVIRERVPHASTHLLPACGHSPTREQPQEVCRILSKVLNRYG